MKKKLVFILSFAFFGTVMLNAQAVKAPSKAPVEEAVKAEVPVLTKEEKKAAIDRKRADRKARSQSTLKAKQSKANKRDQEMFETLKMDEKQIESYNKIQEAQRVGMRKAAQKRKEDRQRFVDDMQKLKEENNAKLKSMMSEEQFRQYMEFNEEKSGPVKNEYKKTVKPEGKQ